jgi:uncharacterized coiled-coil protein SlyX
MSRNQNELATVAFLMDNYMRERCAHLEQQLESLSSVLSQRNRFIAQLNSDIDNLCGALVEAQNENERLLRTDRILHTIDGRTALFRRNVHGIFVEVQDPPEEEPLRNVRRRLNFDTDSDSDMDTDEEFMSRLLGFSD